MDHGAHDGDNFERTANDMCEEGEAYCWMGCRPLPEGILKSKQKSIFTSFFIYFYFLESCDYYQDLRCHSFETGVTCSTDVGGQPMDPTCEWQCVNKTYKRLQSNFCNGGTDMFMTGFETIDPSPKKTCVILFFNAWTLDSWFKFAVAMVGVTLIGLAIEALIAVRRKISKRKGLFIRMTADSRRLLMVILFGLNLILGYLAMLVAMTYSVELFMCVVLGLCVGHFIFNSKSSNVGESIDPCCASQQMANKPAFSRTPCDLEDGDGHETDSDADENDDKKSLKANGTCSIACPVPEPTAAPPNEDFKL